jgi:rhodanese-related sulfurtransferase
VKRILLLVAIPVVLGATANAISPRGLSWTRPLGRGVGPQVTQAGLVPIDLAAMKNLVGSVRILDARTREDFAIGRLPGAVWWTPDAPLPPRDKPIVVYCANEFCEYSLEAGVKLKASGYPDVAIFVDGYEAWWNAGGAVDQD